MKMLLFSCSTDSNAENSIRREEIRIYLFAWKSGELQVDAREREFAGLRAPAVGLADGALGDGANLVRFALCALAGAAGRTAAEDSGGTRNRHI
jgi:hypothetical protein